MFTVAIIGVGNRGRMYGNKLMKYKDAKIVSLCELNNAIMSDMAKKWKVDANKCFTDEKDFFDQGKVADAMIISTQDRDHYRHAIKALELGYHLLLEKPISPVLEECLHIERLAKEKNLHVVVCHVLRYTYFYNAIRDAVRSGVIGDIIDINHTENVGYWHFGHSFVRGNWRRSDETSPSILAKCCHDFDLIHWITGQTATTIYANGSLEYFTQKYRPLNAPKYCLDGCPNEKECPYHVSKIYYKVTRYTIPKMIINMKLITGDPEPTIDKLKKSLVKGPYGRCVYQCDNNVMEQHNTLMQLSNGTTVKLSMSGLSKDMYRSMHIFGTKGEIIAVDKNKELKVNIYGGASYNIKQKTKKSKGHLGGDTGIIRDFVELISKGINSDRITYISDSIESHRNALISEQSRINGKIISISK